MQALLDCCKWKNKISNNRHLSDGCKERNCSILQRLVNPQRPLFSSKVPHPSLPSACTPLFRNLTDLSCSPGMLQHVADVASRSESPRRILVKLLEFIADPLQALPPPQACEMHLWISFARTKVDLWQTTPWFLLYLYLSLTLPSCFRESSLNSICSPSRIAISVMFLAQIVVYEKPTHEIGQQICESWSPVH